MATDLTREKVKNDLHKDIGFYNDKIAEKSANVENVSDRVELEQMKRERDTRVRELDNMSKDENTDPVIRAFDPFR